MNDSADFSCNMCDNPHNGMCSENFIHNTEETMDNEEICCDRKCEDTDLEHLETLTKTSQVIKKASLRRKKQVGRKVGLRNGGQT